MKTRQYISIAAETSCGKVDAFKNVLTLLLYWYQYWPAQVMQMKND